ncbi:MAG: hypothetical protein PHH16_03500 [Candidatus Gracilibacteria bacterium]|nr:hypothetical protein [Candidatus Gracilibacteria bacterium]
MTQTEPLTPTNTQAAEQSVVSPAVAEVMERAHQGALGEIERFIADETSLIRGVLRDGNALIGYILGVRETNPADLSRIISLKKQLRDQETANEVANEARKAA